MVHKRRYPFLRIATSTLLKRPFRKDLHIAATCSEFALECLAIGGTCMVKKYASVEDGKEDFYPADIHASDEFVKSPMTYLRLSD
jgi:hypothetical protein